MHKIIHLSQSIEGALKHWNRSMWKMIADDNNMTVAECKEQFKIMLSEGKKVLPISKDCKTFDYVNGCPGHNTDTKKAPV